jgi:hypothetical protein
MTIKKSHIQCEDTEIAAPRVHVKNCQTGHVRHELPCGNVVIQALVVAQTREY